MIFKNMEFHNVEEIIECRKGYAMQRIPSFVSEKLNEGARNGSAVLPQEWKSDSGCKVIL